MPVGIMLIFHWFTKFKLVIFLIKYFFGSQNIPKETYSGCTFVPVEVCIYEMYCIYCIYSSIIYIYIYIHSNSPYPGTLGPGTVHNSETAVTGNTRVHFANTV